ncbi:MAG: hypothetical protein ACI32N_01295 [Bulleidia sp.]
MRSDDLKWYSGDVSAYDPSDPLYGDPRAYVTLNALLFEGMETEQARVAEGRRLNPAFIQRVEETVSLIRGIDSCLTPLSEPCIVRRVERLSDYSVFIQSGKMPSFISTSDAGFLSSYQDKFGLVFMEMHLHEGVRCVRLEDVLDEYRKENEKEVLLGYDCPITIRQIPIPEQYAGVKDGRGDPVVVYAVVDVWPQRYEKKAETGLSDDMIDASVRVYDCLNHGVEPDETDIRRYLALKQYIQQQSHE